MDSLDSAFFSSYNRFFRGKDIFQSVDGINSSSFISIFKGLFNMHFGEFDKFELGIGLGCSVNGINGFTGILFVSSIN